MTFVRDSFGPGPSTVPAVPAAPAAEAPKAATSARRYGLVDSFVSKLVASSGHSATDSPPAKRMCFARDSFGLSDAPSAAPEGCFTPAPFNDAPVYACTSPRMMLEQDCSTAQSLADLLMQDRSRFAICRGDPALLRAACEFSFAQADKAFSLRTALKDSSNWRLWKKYCTHMGTTPWRTTASASKLESPAEYLREVVLLTYALGYAMQHKKPRSNSDRMIKPATAMAFLHSVSRVHKRNHLSLIPLSAVSLPLKGLMRDYVKVCGPMSLVPKRREPFTNPLIASLLHPRHEGKKLGRKTLKWSSLFGCSLSASIELASETGFRKGELFASNEEAHFLKWEAISVRLKNVWVPSGSMTAVMWASMQATDCVAVIPPHSKADQFGMVWGPLPCYRQFRPVGRSAARRIRDLAIAVLDKKGALTEAVFVDDDCSPLTCSTMASTLFYLLSSFLPAAAAKMYTWHSFRISLACALLAAKCSNAQIQAVLRWQTEESLRIYARMGVEEQLSLVSQAQLATISAVQSRNLPIFEKFDLFLAMQSIADD